MLATPKAIGCRRCTAVFLKTVPVRGTTVAWLKVECRGGLDALCIGGCGYSPDSRARGSGHYRHLFRNGVRYRFLLLEKGADFGGLLPGRAQNRLVCHRRFPVCLQYFHRTLYWSRGFRCHLRACRGEFRVASLGHFVASRLGICPVLSPLERIHHAGVSRAAI